MLGSESRGGKCSSAMTNLTGLGIEANEQFVGDCDTHHFGWLAGSAKALLEGDEVRFIAGDDAAHDEQDVADGGATSTNGAFALVFA